MKENGVVCYTGKVVACDSAYKDITRPRSFELAYTKASGEASILEGRGNRKTAENGVFPLLHVGIHFSNER